MTDEKLIDIPFLHVAIENDKLYDKGNMRVEMTFLRNPNTTDEVEEFLPAMEEIFSKEKFFTIVFDASKLTNISIPQAKTLRDCIVKTQDQMNTKIVACAAIFPPGSVMEFLRKFFKPKNSHYKTQFCATIEECRTFLSASETKIKK